jgi:hypothetical protein
MRVLAAGLSVALLACSEAPATENLDAMPDAGATRRSILCLSSGHDALVIRPPLPFASTSELVRGERYTFAVAGDLGFAAADAPITFPFESQIALSRTPVDLLEVDGTFRVWNPFVHAWEAPISQRGLVCTAITLLANRLRRPDESPVIVERGDTHGVSILCIPI